VNRPACAVLAVCGFSGSGKTTLLAALLTRLVGRGLAVAVVKHDAHGIQVDSPGKDSDRLFRAGATVALRSPGESFWRWHEGDATAFARTLGVLAASHDLVLVEGHKSTPTPKLWLSGPTADLPPDGVSEVLAVLPWDGDRVAAAEQLVSERLAAAWRQRPLLGGLLVGGTSRRMGQAKALVEVGGSSLAERADAALAAVAGEVVLLGAGPVPTALAGRRRLPDAPGLVGPVAGLVAALRWAPEATWVVAACDLALVDDAATRWLVGQRRPGVWAVLPATAGGVEPLLAVYEPQAGPLVADLAAAGIPPRALCDHPKTLTPAPPDDLARAWTNVNTPADLASLS
jgi:molybdopterin-guanine dinucleotide biosynthesis protein MobB